MDVRERCIEIKIYLRALSFECSLDLVGPKTCNNNNNNVSTDVKRWTLTSGRDEFYLFTLFRNSKVNIFRIFFIVYPLY